MAPGPGLLSLCSWGAPGGAAWLRPRELWPESVPRGFSAAASWAPKQSSFRGPRADPAHTSPPTDDGDPRIPSAQLWSAQLGPGHLLEGPERVHLARGSELQPPHPAPGSASSGD